MCLLCFYHFSELPEAVLGDFLLNGRRDGMSRTKESVRGLCVLKPPATTGYSVNFLRNESGLGQALAYIRPLQRSLDTSPDVEEVRADNITLLIKDFADL